MTKPTVENAPDHETATAAEGSRNLVSFHHSLLSSTLCYNPLHTEEITMIAKSMREHIGFGATG
jgi:hypothetical protein